MRFLRGICLSVLILLPASPAFALWCGNDLIMEDQRISEVREVLKSNECGERLSTEKIGSVREVVQWHDPFFYPHLGFYGHRHHPHGGYYGAGWRPGFDRVVYDSERIEKWRVRITNRQGVPYCYDLVFRSGVLRAIGIGDPCDSDYSPDWTDRP